MIKTYRRQLIVVVILICCFAATLMGSCLFASNTNNIDNYKIINYDVNINITDENFYEVQESIFVNFPVPKHGIFRFIPYRFPENRNIFPRIENINVPDHPFDVYTDNTSGASVKVLKIGNADKKLIGNHVYKINFNYKLGRIPENQQFIYYNIMGNMSTNIDKGRIRIKLPRAIDDSKIQFFQGAIDSKEAFTNFSYDDINKVIVADIVNPIGPNEFLTVFIPVSDNYFSAANILLSIYDIFLPGYLIASIAVLIIILFLWFLFGRSHKIVSIVEFYPPKGLSPIAVDKYLRETDLDVITPDKVKKSSSLFYYLANKGYLSISFEGKNSFILKKTNKQLSEEADHIVYFYNSIFKEKDEVVKADIEKNYYEIASNTISMLPACRVISSKSKGFMILGFILACIPVIPIIMGLADKTLVGMFMSIFVYLATLVIFCISGNILEKSISGIGRGKCGSFVVIIATIISGSLILIFIVGIVSLIVLYLLFSFSFLWSFFIRKRNTDQAILMGRLKGFRTFINKAKKDELEKLINESPTYFYDVLPYSHVFGVTKVWIDKFKDIDIVQPDWYQSNNDIPFTCIWLYEGLIDNMNSSISTCIQSSINQFPFRIVPVPREISTSCGIAVRLNEEDSKTLEYALKKYPIIYEEIYKITK